MNFIYKYRKLIFGVIASAIGFYLFYSCDANLEIDRSLDEIKGETPTINSFAPETVPLMGNFTVKGTGLNFVKKAFINGEETSIHQRVSKTQIIIRAGKNVSSGPIKLVTGAKKEVVSDENINITYPLPIVTSEAPKSSQVNENITLEGKNLDVITNVTFGDEEGFIEFQEKEALVVKTPESSKKVMELAIHYNDASGEQTDVLESNYAVIVPTPEILTVPRLMVLNDLIEIKGENMNLIDSIKVGGVKTGIKEATPSSIEFKVPDNLNTDYYSIVFNYSGGKEVTLEEIPYIDGKFIKLLDFDDYPIDMDEIKFDPDLIEADQKYVSDPDLQPPFPPNSEIYYSVVHKGRTGSSVTEIKISEIGDNKEKLAKVLDDGAYNDTPYLHFWYKSDDKASLKIWAGGKRRELETDHRNTNGEWILVAVNLKGFISTLTDLADMKITLSPTSGSSGKEIKEQSIDWFIITDQLLTEFDAEDWTSDTYWKDEG